MSHRLLLIYLLALHALVLGPAVLLLQTQPIALLSTEVCLVVSLLVGLSLWRRQRATTRVLRDGTAALRDQDYSLRLAEVGVRDVDELIGVYNSLLDRVREERRDNQRQHFFLQLLIESTNLGVITMDFDGNIEHINSWGRAQLGLTKASQLPPKLDHIHHPLAMALAELADDERKLVRLPSNQRFRCESAYFIDRGFRRRFLVVNNISGELTDAEVAAYGKVIRMMAHEVNNATAATRSLLQSLLDTDDLDDSAFRELAREYLPMLEARGEEQNEFMRRFAEVVRLPEPRLETVDLAELLKGQVNLIRPLLDAQRISVTTDLQTCEVQADAALLRQVVSNALTNARESLLELDGVGQLHISCHDDTFEIADYGPGIPAEVEAQLFTPFFSTKPTGQGIGLTLTREVLEQHGASYRLSTDGDGWTRLVVAFDGGSAEARPVALRTT